MFVLQQLCCYFPVRIMHKDLCDRSCLYVYMQYIHCVSQTIDCLVSFESWKIAHSTFLSHLDIVNVMVDCWSTPSRALFLFLYLYLCALLGVVVPWGQTLGVLQGMVILTCHASSSCIHMYAAPQPCSVCTEYVFFGTVVKHCMKLFVYVCAD